jgi:hypothetical protein
VRLMERKRGLVCALLLFELERGWRS